METLLTLKEVADDLKVCRATAYRWVKGNKIPAIIIGRTIRVRQSDLDMFLAQSSSSNLTGKQGGPDEQ
ncbi:helix-turn-helix domain-containing protein [Geobacter sulfurreducens]|uniref:helix-turn-helix domain-containing protein n=1 Tax=Geobacter sulfurreducens TaxID=35554 RepID=UPI0020B86A38|nr:helix-turn-helix domain-containing protein [Geobacter sulfurreducens]UTG93161.1 helix-turn-helix domain-containing protein [Geobacter sulfurreducens]